MEGKGEEGKWEGRQEALGPCLQWPFQDFINGPKSLLPILILILPDIFFTNYSLTVQLHVLISVCYLVFANYDHKQNFGRQDIFAQKCVKS